MWRWEHTWWPGDDLVTPVPFFHLCVCARVGLAQSKCSSWLSISQAALPHFQLRFPQDQPQGLRQLQQSPTHPQTAEFSREKASWEILPWSGHVSVTDWGSIQGMLCSAGKAWTVGSRPQVKLMELATPSVVCFYDSSNWSDAATKRSSMCNQQ